MEILKNALNALVYYYYPKNLHESDLEYFKTPENQNHLSLRLKWEKFKIEIDAMVNIIREDLDNDRIVSNSTSNNSSCYEIEIPLIDNGKQQVLTIYISLLAPFYHSVLLHYNDSGEIDHSFDIPINLKNYFEKLLKNKLYYIEFPRDFLDCLIPDIFVSPNFSYRTAFFTDQYRIVHRHP